MRIGKRIYKIRKLNNINQNQVAKGIISSSHLSNIEAGRNQPPSDILKLLAKRLNLPEEYLTMVGEENKVLSDYLNQLEQMLDTDYKQASTIYKKIEAEFPFIYSLQQEFHFYLLEALLYVRFIDLAKATVSLKKIEFLFDEESFKSLPTDLKKLYYYVLALYHYYSKDYLKSNHYYQQQLSLIQSDAEKAKVFFNLALVFYKLKDLINSIAYAKSSLEIYLHLHQMEKVVDNYIFLTALYWESKQIDLAEEMINKALSLCEKFHLTNNLDKIYHNKGLINESRKRFQESLECFTKSLELKKKYQKANVNLTLRSMIEIHLQLGQVDKAKQLILYAQTFCKNELDQCYLTVYKAKICLMYQQFNEYEKLMEESIHVLLNNKDEKYLINSVEELGSYYQQQQKYKKAAYYFKLVLQVLKE